MFFRFLKNRLHCSNRAINWVRQGITVAPSVAFPCFWKAGIFLSGCSMSRWLSGMKAGSGREAFLRNSSSFYMRVLRSVYNKAVTKRLVKQTFPFQNVYTGVDKTRKRAIDEQHILDLCKLSLPALSPLALARDLFLFSYCTRGMAFVDMAFLCKKNIHNGYICYTRKKTGQQLVIRVEPLIQKIISRYAGQTKRSQYLLPIISSEDPVIAFSQYQTALGYYNKLLKRISKILDLDISLSSYTARHSWATAARNHNVPISVISAGMGHTTEKTTQIYLASLESSVIDQANQSILSALV